MPSNTKKIAEIEDCKDFIQLFYIVSPYMSWEENSILTHIVFVCGDPAEAKQEIENFRKKLALIQGLEIAFSMPQHCMSEDVARFCEIIDKPYKNISDDDYEEVKAYILSSLNTHDYVNHKFIRILYVV